MSEAPVWTGSGAEEQRSCLIKMRYETRRRAKSAADAMRRRGIVVKVYACRYCSGFHVGHERQRGQVADRRSLPDS